MQQFNLFKAKSQKSRRKSQDPVLTAEDEAFLRNVAVDSSPAMEQISSPLPPETGDRAAEPATTLEATIETELPMSPAEEFGRELGEEARQMRSRAETEPLNSVQASSVKIESSAPSSQPRQPEKKMKSWSWMWRRNHEKKDKEVVKETTGSPTTAARENNLKEAAQEREDMTEILDRLNLAADNNRVFSIGDETQELLRKFKLIFKDLINGVPTAYHDLEMLLTNGNRQLQDTYSQLPGFLQKLIEKLPERWTESLAPEIIAAAAERATQSGINVDNIGKAAAAANKMGIKVPNLKELVGKPAAIVGMFRSIIAFLRARFPAALGMNVLWSLALFILLFVLWYCHKRGREVRIENERLVTEDEIGKMNEESADGTKIRSTETLVTTAPHGASTAEVHQGIKEARQAREAQVTKKDDPKQETASESKSDSNSMKPTRSKSVLSIFGRSTSSNTTTPKVAPYPGT
ncbi:hypothetical protein P175DRAFT_0476587 [Aspergillus ochraceoroseus IBT 24754]|uniref:Uncharacterized protein n=1 Tax=Aspergillus ochraceoroseus IBT 24754 TaxID=1392256 RepID=A0A2T5LYV5_9EURO|nr:uncharacterized protein P175DRAFT_0476587 [Aspergillus ochraceoroseus IBT 24754]PTU21456.1 hypothetical protein P175DRAFT_0476587 [Aspergillus ochraceoroseus IBT 24754]